MTSAAVSSETKTEIAGPGRRLPETRFSLPDSLDALPRPVARPVQWGRLRLHLSRLKAGKPEHILESAYSVGDAIGGMSDERHLRRLWRTPRGRALLESGSSLADALADRDALRAMAPNSLGRAFLTFAERHGIDVLELIESEHEVSRDYEKLDPLRRWLSDRLTVSHDLWHVLAGYDATPPGESALMGFSLPQRANDRALPIFISMSVASGKLRARDAIQAIRRGMRASYLVEEQFEELLPLPLDAVRKRLRIEPPEVAHPGDEVPSGMLVPSESSIH
jgi:ubiquinone biosynthesis protein Coq4